MGAAARLIQIRPPPPATTITNSGLERRAIVFHGIPNCHYITWRSPGCCAWADVVTDAFVQK
jgi:hypothetical protein